MRPGSRCSVVAHRLVTASDGGVTAWRDSPTSTPISLNERTRGSYE
jgi:hypothetical protein